VRNFRGRGSRALFVVPTPNHHGPVLFVHTVLYTRNPHAWRISAKLHYTTPCSYGTCTSTTPPTDELTTILQLVVQQIHHQRTKICQIPTSWLVEMLGSCIAMWQICCTTSCRIVVSLSVGSVVQHVRSRCPCSRDKSITAANAVNSVWSSALNTFCLSMNARPVGPAVRPISNAADRRLSRSVFAPERRVPKSYSSCSCCWGYQFSKNLQYAAERNETLHTHSCWHPHRSTVSDFQINF